LHHLQQHRQSHHAKNSNVPFCTKNKRPPASIHQGEPANGVLGLIVIAVSLHGVFLSQNQSGFIVEWRG
jgi:hypothetical protein